MTSTPRFALPYLAPNQAQKHVTLNESLRRLDLVEQLAAFSRTSGVPSEDPAEGDCWIVGAAATGSWEGHDGKITSWLDGAWAFAEPQPGWLAYVLDENLLVV